MNAPDSIDDVLGVEDLRAAFLSYTRHAYALLPAMGQPRFLDIGCGTGQATIELARLSGSSVVGIDPDATALSELRRRIEADRLGHRIEIVNASLFEVSFADESFDLLWEEGVLHLLDSTKSLAVCRRLLKPGGFLVMHETVVWFESIRANLSADGFGIVNEYLLPERCWWTDYYAPLEDRIRLLREERGREIASKKLAQYEREIAMVKANPDRFDCGFFILQKL